MKPKTTLLLALLVFCSGFRAATAEVVPVVSANNPVDSLSRYGLVDIFLGKTHRFPNGDPAIPLDQAEDSAVRMEFYSKYANKSAAQIKAHWSKMIFTGRGRPPKAVTNDSSVKQWVAKHPDAIGYIDRSLVDSSVKILQVQ